MSQMGHLRRGKGAAIMSGSPPIAFMGRVI
jgi:hypothetical protein